jgi:acyl carrier protein
MQSKEAILERVRSEFGQLFEIPAERVTSGARLYEDLEIDSIDAIDLVERVRRFTGKKITTAEFRSVRTVGDLVEVMHRLVQEP